MRVTPRVVLLGRSLDASPGWEPVELSAVGALKPGARSPILAIAGDDLIDGVQPGDLPQPKHDSLQILLVPRRCSYSAFATWILARRPHVAAPDGIAATVKRILERGIGVRQRLEPEEWCETSLERGSAAWTALRLLPFVDCCHDVGAWAKELGWSRQLLWEICQAHLDATPSIVMFDHTRAQVAQARRRGYSVETIARALGYSGADNLTHSYTRRRLRIPREES